jgi:hypothetical protein
MTGLAQPKTGAPTTASRIGKIMVPKISMWAMGFRVIRPWSRGVAAAVGYPGVGRLVYRYGKEHGGELDNDAEDVCHYSAK